MFNTAKILNRMATLGLDMKMLARACGVKKRTMERIISNRSAADTMIAEQLRECLQLESRESGSYFFCHGVAI